MVYSQEVNLSREHAGFDLHIRVKVLSAKPAVILNRYGDVYGQTIYLVVPCNRQRNQKLDRRKIHIIAVEIFETHCQHQFDCCGNWYRSVGLPRRVSSRTWAIPLLHCHNI